MSTELDNKNNFEYLDNLCESYNQKIIICNILSRLLEYKHYPLSQEDSDKISVIIDRIKENGLYFSDDIFNKVSKFIIDSVVNYANTNKDEKYWFYKGLGNTNVKDIKLNNYILNCFGTYGKNFSKIIELIGS